AIEELEEEIRRENDRRYAFYRMLNATDRVLWRLEEVDRGGVKQIPGDMRGRMKGSVARPPTACMEGFRESRHVEEVLDSVFEVEERLFRWRDRQRLPEDEEELERVAV